MLIYLYDLRRAPQVEQMMAFQNVEWMGIRQNVVEVSMSATRAPRPQREHVPATGFVRRTFFFWSIRKQKHTILFSLVDRKCVFCVLSMTVPQFRLYTTILTTIHYTHHSFITQFPLYPFFSH